MDGLRGIAAFLVVLFHLRIAVNETAEEWLWPIVDKLLSYGYLGVDVFFVISGFVISYSVRNADHTPAYLLRFGIRRSIRLDPPYWLTIVLELILIKLGLIIFSDLDTPFPSTAKILAHFVYMQNLLGFGNINDVFWTLCYEIQFYIIFVGAFVVTKLTRVWLGDWQARYFVFSVGTVAFLWSWLIFFGPAENPIHGLFIDRWYQFFIGVLAMQSCHQRSIKPGFLLASVMMLAGSLLYPENGIHNGITALAAAWVLVLSAQREKMSKWLAGSTIQFMGRISYSLYLIHPVVGWRFVKVVRELFGADFSPIQAWLVLAGGVGASVASAWLMYRFIELPSLQVCHQIRMDRPLNLGRLWKSIRVLRKHS